MSKVIFQFAHGVLVAGEKQLTEPTEKRNLGLDEQPANPYAGESVQDESAEQGSQEPESTEEPATNIDSGAPAADSASSSDPAATDKTK